jgi:hypothetical protein
MCGFAASARVNDFRRRVPVDGPVHFVLHRLKKLLRHFR